MKTTRIVAVAAFIVGSGLAFTMARAQAPGITRTDLQKHDLSIPGREAVQVVVSFAPGVVAPRHSHPGEEIVSSGTPVSGATRPTDGTTTCCSWSPIS